MRIEHPSSQESELGETVKKLQMASSNVEKSAKTIEESENKSTSPYKAHFESRSPEDNAAKDLASDIYAFGNDAFRELRENMKAVCSKGSRRMRTRRARLRKARRKIRAAARYPRRAERSQSRKKGMDVDKVMDELSKNLLYNSKACDTEAVQMPSEFTVGFSRLAKTRALEMYSI